MGFRIIFRRAVVLPIEIYRRIVSPLFPGACIYTPSCSSYARDAILQHGVLPGALLAIGRLGRCVGALYRGGEDPVPETFSLRGIGRGYGRFWRRRPPRARPEGTLDPEAHGIRERRRDRSS